MIGKSLRKAGLAHTDGTFHHDITIFTQGHTKILKTT
jgi:hypothetical protein